MKLGMGRLKERIKEKVSEQLTPLLARLDPLRAQWSRMSPKDQKSAMILAGIVSFTLLGLLIRGAQSELKSLNKSIESRQQAVERIENRTQEYDSLTRELNGLKARGLTARLSTFIEEKARESKIADQLDKIQDQRSEDTEFFNETVVEVRLKKVSLSGLTRFMHAVEQSGKAARVQSLRVKPTFQDPRYLEATLEVVGYKPIAKGS